jgi:Sulfatase-modifying factor enzyme 1/Domain of unknown function (DUF4062)
MMKAFRRVFLSHTSEFASFPEKKSFIDAAVAAVNRAGCVPCDMGYFTARDEKPAEYCKERIRECDVYVGVMGFRYGSPVRDRPEVSYTELEFEAACETSAVERLVFVLDQVAQVPVGLFSDNQYGDRQVKFRKRISDAGVMCKPFSDVHELEKLIYQALVESDGSKIDSSKPDRIDWPDDKSPYPGLLSFDQEYAELFFGRDREVDAVIAKMSDPEGRFLIISGASGSGKSSVVGAGLWRELIREDRIAGSKTWEWLRIQPGDGKKSPFEALAWGLKQTSLRITQRPEKLADELAAGSNNLGKLLAPKLGGEQELLLFVDQLEELFTADFRAQDVGNFLKQLVTSACDDHNRLRVIATLRSEFISRLEESESVLPLLNTGCNYHLGPVSPRVLQDMIEKPALATGCKFEPRLVEDILSDASQEPGALPLVAYALKQLFDRRRERTFTRDAYEKFRGVAGAIGTQADHVISGLDAEALGAFDQVFAELVHIERDRPPARKRVTLAVFKADEGASKLINALAGPECRVLVTGGDGREPSVEVAHEKLFTAWPKLSEWIDNGGDALRLIDHVTEAARRWENGGDNSQELWPATRAAEVTDALQRFGKKASPVLDRFLRPQEVLIKQLDQDSLSHQQRTLIGRTLVELGDSRSGVGLCKDGLPDIAWVEIAGGKVKLDGIETVFDAKPFRIAKYVVTNVQFEAFIKDAGYRNTEWWKGMKQSEGPAEPSWKEANSPRETVSWYEAVAFCRWLSKRTGSKIRLPTEWEWQLAATGGDPEREYPWPGGWDPTRCNSYESRLNRTCAVGVYPGGATRQGVLDMAGNVWEWCLNKYEKPGSPESLNIDDDERGQRVLRGGSWYGNPDLLHLSLRYRLSATSRYRNYADYQNYGIGFRLAQDIE